jgi:hypothetical protein
LTQIWSQATAQQYGSALHTQFRHVQPVHPGSCETPHPLELPQLPQSPGQFAQCSPRATSQLESPQFTAQPPQSWEQFVQSSPAPQWPSPQTGPQSWPH